MKFIKSEIKAHLYVFIVFVVLFVVGIALIFAFKQFRSIGVLGIQSEEQISSPGIIFNPTFVKTNYKENNSAIYSIVLSKNPESNFYVDIDVSGSQFYLNESKSEQSSRVEFSSVNWDIPRYIKLYFHEETLPGYKSIKHITQAGGIFFYNLNVEYIKPVFTSENNSLNVENSEYQYSVKLNGEPLEPLLVKVILPSNSNLYFDSEKTIKNLELNFDESNWLTEQTINLYYDTISIGDSFNITHEVLGQQYTYQLKVDGLYPILSETEFEIFNNTPNQIEYSIKLNQKPDKEELVEVKTNSEFLNFDDEQKLDSTILSFDESNWNTPQSVNIFLKANLPYTEYFLSNKILNVNNVVEASSERTISIKVYGIKLRFPVGKIFSTNLNNGFIDITFELDSNPSDETEIDISKVNSDDKIFFNEGLTQQENSIIINSENWSELKSVRVYFDSTIESFKYYELNLELNGQIQVVKVYPFLE